MTRTGLVAFRLCVGLSGIVWVEAAATEPLTAEGAVKLALQRNSQVIGAEAAVLDARSGLYGAYSGVLPRLNGSVTRSGQWQQERTGAQVFGGFVSPIDRSDYEDFSTLPSLDGSWSVLNFSSLTGLLSARNGLQAAQFQRRATRQDAALATRREFYEVVKAVRLAQVAAGALHLAHDDERRVRALFEVGSVSKSDLLKAQLRTAQSVLDSLTARQAVINQRILLARQLGLKESEMQEVDTLLIAEPREYDETSLLAEARRIRPDLLAADAELRAARTGLRSANLLRMPYVTLGGGLTYRPKSAFKVTTFDTSGVPLPAPLVEAGNSKDDLQYNARISLNWDLFTGLATESRIAAAQARLVRAKDGYDALDRNLQSEIHQALLAYREATEREQVARSAVESATENLKLTQEKYNVGSATILELIDAQVQLQRAQSDIVSALAAIRVAEAQVDRVRGRAE